jgi:4-amino-4-deoxy-L-arabinose transferase-like glycosyltransferase
MSRSKVLIIIVFLAAAAIRFADIFRPIDQASWRECDLGAISRNFVREGMDPLYPRIDWRGNGPGYSEMELPLFPFLTAISYEIFGIHDQLGRVWSFLFSLGALFFFYRLAREYLGIFSSLIAFAFFALNPLVVEQSTAVQPEGLMLFAYIAAAYFFIRWIRTEANTEFWCATAMTALALLAKAPAAHIGLFFGILLIKKYGSALIKQPKIWIFVVLSLVPTALWYSHAKNLWLTYGNSLGVSNECHWIGPDFFTNPDFLIGILRLELLNVWAIFGVLVGAFAIGKGGRELAVKQSLLWLVSIFALYVIAARTTSEDWASYYHVFSVAPAALIFGVGVKKLLDNVQASAEDFSRRSLVKNLFRAAVLAMVTVAVLASLLLEAKQVRANFLNKRLTDNAYACATQIRPALKQEGLIVASGGHCVGKNGYALAYNASFMFYWLDRKGWNVCIEDQSPDKIAAFAAKGAEYFVAQRSMLKQKAGFEEELRHDYPVVSECDEFVVFELTKRD